MEQLERRVEKIEKIFWVIGVVAVIFGIAGGIGASVISSTKTEIVEIKKTVDGQREEAEKIKKEIKDDITRHGIRTTGNISKNVDEIIKPDLNNYVYSLKQRLTEGSIYQSRESQHIKVLGEHNVQTIDVNKGDVLYAMFTASARQSSFYFGISVDSQLAKPLMKSTQLIQNSSQKWEPISTQGLFEIIADGKLRMATNFSKSDVEGKVHVYGSTLVIQKIAYKPQG